MKYETIFIFPELIETRDDILQKAHDNLSEDFTEFKESKFGAKSLIGFTPISPDGIMLPVWTDGSPKHRTKEEIKQDSNFCIFLMEFLLLKKVAVSNQKKKKETISIISRISFFNLLFVAFAGCGRSIW